MGVCLSVTLHIVDLWQYYLFCIILCGTRCSVFMVLYLCLCSSAGHTACLSRSSIYICASSLQNLAVPQDFVPLPSWISACGTILLTLYSKVCDLWVLIARQCFFYLTMQLAFYLSSNLLCMWIGFVRLHMGSLTDRVLHHSAFPIRKISMVQRWLWLQLCMALCKAL